MLRVRGWLGSDLALLAALASITRLALFLVARPSPQRFWSLDDRDYLPIATHLHAAYLEGRGPLFDLGLRRPPGYPLFVRAVYDVLGRHYGAVIAVQLVLSVATVWLTYRLATQVLPRRVALIGAALVALDPASIVFANQLLTETLFTLLVTAALALAVRAWQRGSVSAWVCAGLLLGLTVLIRPVAQFLPIALIPVLLVAAARDRRRATLLGAFALAIGFLVPTGLWTLRNHHETGVATISTIDGYTMLQYNAVGALIESGTPRQQAQHDVLVRLARHVRPGDNAAQVSRAELRVARAVLVEHPVGAFKDWVKGEARLLFGPARSETATLLTGRSDARAPWLRVIVVVEALVTAAIALAALSALVLLLIGRLAIPELWILVAAAAYLVVVSGGHQAYSRFRVPVDPLLAVLAAAAYWRLRAAVGGRFRERRII